MKLIFTSAALTMFVATLLIAILHYLKVMRSQVLPVSFESPLIPASDKPITKLPVSDDDAVYWAQLSEWHLEAQSDDRRPINGSVSGSSGSAGSRRSVARLSHQAMYKEWSKERHD